MVGGPVSETDLMDYWGITSSGDSVVRRGGRGDLICGGRGRAIREVGRRILVYGYKMSVILL